MRAVFFCLSIFLFDSSLKVAFANWTGKWDSKGADAIIGLSTEPQNPDFGKNSFLIVGYSTKFACSPVVSVLVINGQRLGSPIEQKTSKSKKNQLVVTVGSKEFTDETKLTKYSNGMELAMRGNQDLVESLKNQSSPFSATIGTLKLIDFAKASGFEAANAQAKGNCK
jgi:hypothetical protein